MKKYQIKKLKWKKLNFNWYRAINAFGSYNVEEGRNNKFYWSYIFQEYYDEEGFNCKSIEDGKQKAERDWIKRLEKVLIKDKETI